MVVAVLLVLEHLPWSDIAGHQEEDLAAATHDQRKLAFIISI
jgi:hypothetical protein